MLNSSCSISARLESLTRDFLVIYGWMPLGKMYAMKYMVKFKYIHIQLDDSLVTLCMSKSRKWKCVQKMLYICKIISTYKKACARGLQFKRGIVQPTWSLENIELCDDIVFRDGKQIWCVHLRLTFPGFSATWLAASIWNLLDAGWEPQFDCLSK